MTHAQLLTDTTAATMPVSFHYSAILSEFFDDRPSGA